MAIELSARLVRGPCITLAPHVLGCSCTKGPATFLGRVRERQAKERETKPPLIPALPHLWFLESAHLAHLLVVTLWQSVPLESVSDSFNISRRKGFTHTKDRRTPIHYCQPDDNY